MGTLQQRNRKTVLLTLLVTAGMFGFGFALVPLYEVFCEVTGLNGKTGGRYELTAADQPIDNRQIRVQFVTQTNAQLPWEFRPEQKSIEVHPGQAQVVYFYARNPTGKTMTVQAVPSVTPFAGAAFFHKVECFCFTRQRLEPQGEVRMPLQFLVSKDLPTEYSTLTLSYTLFDLTEETADKAS